VLLWCQCKSHSVSLTIWHTAESHRHTQPSSTRGRTSDGGLFIESNRRSCAKRGLRGLIESRSALFDFSGRIRALIRLLWLGMPPQLVRLPGAAECISPGGALNLPLFSNARSGRRRAHRRCESSCSSRSERAEAAGTHRQPQQAAGRPWTAYRRKREHLERRCRGCGLLGGVGSGVAVQAAKGPSRQDTGPLSASSQ
jgi:hypothetical protein